MNWQKRLDDLYRELDPEYAEALMNPDGSARQALWNCEDGYNVGYTTERIRGGPFDGKFAVMVYRPSGKGSRSGKATTWNRIYFRGFAKRKTPRARAEKFYWSHNPKRAERSGK